MSKNANGHVWENVWCFILYAFLEKSCVWSFPFYIPLQSAFLYFCCLTDDGEDDGSDSHAEMVTTFSISISSYLSTEENRRKGNFFLFWENVRSWLDSVAWEGLIIDWKFSYSCPGLCYSHVIETFLPVKTNERDQRLHCCSACWSVTGNTAASEGGHRACEQEIISLWSKNIYLLCTWKILGLYLRVTLLLRLFTNLFTFGLVLNRIFSQTSYKKSLVEKDLNTCRAQDRRT